MPAYLCYTSKCVLNTVALQKNNSLVNL